METWLIKNTNPFTWC